MKSLIPQGNDSRSVLFLTHSVTSNKSYKTNLYLSVWSTHLKFHCKIKDGVSKVLDDMFSLNPLRKTGLCVSVWLSYIMYQDKLPWPVMITKNNTVSHSLPKSTNKASKNTWPQCCGSASSGSGLTRRLLQKPLYYEEVVYWQKFLSILGN